MMKSSLTLSMILLVSLLSSCARAPATGTVQVTEAAMTPTPAEAQSTVATAMVVMATSTVIPSPAATSTPTMPPTPAKVQYTVRPGDTLSVIAKQHGVSMAAIQLANGMDANSMLQSGQKIDIPTGPTWEGESTFWIVHVVQVGESLASIAQTYHVAQNDLVRINAIADPSIIRLGSHLVIPLDTVWVAAAPTLSTPTKAPTASSATSTPPTAKSTTPSVTVTPRPAATLATATPGIVAPPSDAAAWPNTIVALINDKRVLQGLPRYKVSAELMRAAMAHANDCSSRGFGSHVGSDGSDTRTRLVRAGYSPLSYWGENWVQALSPEQAVSVWYNETPPNDPHRQNLLNRSYVDIGIGVAKADNGYYVIADFAAKQ